MLENLTIVDFDRWLRYFIINWKMIISIIIIVIVILVLVYFLYLFLKNNLTTNNATNGISIDNLPLWYKLKPLFKNQKIKYSLKRLMLLAIIYFILIELPFSPKFDIYFKKIGLIVFAIYLTFIAKEILDYLFKIYFVKDEGNTMKLKGFQGILSLFTIVLWIVSFIFVFENLGFSMSSVIAGVSIGGVAIALASQTFLGDIVNYFAIIFDEPFGIDDFIILDNYMGTVEEIGLKTTKIRSLSGEQLILSNSDLMKGRIQNFKRMVTRRVVFQINVVPTTSRSSLEIIPIFIKEIINSIPQTKFDRSNLSTFSNFSFQFETVYYVLSSDYNLYMNIQQNILFKIYDELSTRKIELAFLPKLITAIFDPKISKT